MAKRPQKSKGPAVRKEGFVRPIYLGQDGVVVGVDEERYTISAGVPGDKMEIRVRGKSGHADSRPNLLKPSLDRVPSPCPVLEECGACTLLAMAYRTQIAAKGGCLKRILQPLGCPPGRVGRLTGLKQPLGFRTKLLMPAFTARNNTLRFGLYRPGTTRPVPAEHCPVQHPLALGLLAMIRPLLDRHGVSASGPGHTGGWLHAISIRVDPPTGAVELILCGRTPEPPGGNNLVDALGRLPGVNTLAVSSAPKRSSYPLNPPFNLLRGRGVTPFTLQGKSYALSPGTFFQTNLEGAELLLAQVEELMPSKVRFFADLYGGAGVFARALASRWEKALVVERSPEAVADLRRTAKHESLPNLDIWEGAVEDRTEAILRRKPDLVLVDPPRRGCKAAVINALNKEPPAELIYVACGVNAFVQDTRKLTQGSFVLKEVHPVDMFPHTAHLELVAKFEAK